MSFTLKRDALTVGAAGDHDTLDDAKQAATAERRRMEDASEGGRLTIEDSTGKEVWGATVTKPIDVR